MNKNTPGPWFVGESDNMTEAIVANIGGFPVPVAFPILLRREHGGEAAKTANANLMAAAPEMLAALYRLRQYLGEGCDWGVLDKTNECAAWLDCEGAIAKAEAK